jgi:voltage-gated potassium channel
MISLFSLTFLLADCLKKWISGKAFRESEYKQMTNKEKVFAVKKARAKIIELLNSTYLRIAIGSCFIIFLYQWLNHDSMKIQINLFWAVLWSIFLFSRINEIFYAFLHDAFSRLKESPKTSSLNNAKRLKLSLKSYIELIFNFAIFYFIVPTTFWKCDHGVTNIIESIYFSGVTITTLGYGDITPTHPIVQIATVYEVFCGFILLIIAFAMYTKEEKPKKPSS